MHAWVLLWSKPADNIATESLKGLLEMKPVVTPYGLVWYRGKDLHTMLKQQDVGFCFFLSASSDVSVNCILGHPSQSLFDDSSNDS